MSVQQIIPRKGKNDKRTVNQARDYFTGNYPETISGKRERERERERESCRSKENSFAAK